MARASTLAYGEEPRCASVGELARASGSSVSEMFYLASILRRVEAAGTGAEFQYGATGTVGALAGAVPETGAAVDALLAVEDGHSVGAVGDRLAGAYLDAGALVAGGANIIFLMLFSSKNGLMIFV